MKLKSYAKINLTLDILGKRPDGYHEIETVFQQVALSDDIDITLLDEDKIIIGCDIPEIDNDSNIAYRSASLVKEMYGIKTGVKITIKKNIPLSAGLAGGSSNAATVIRGLNKLWDLGLDDGSLMDLCTKIGMDVPFHIMGGTALGTGRNEIMKKLNDFPLHHVVIVHPGFSIMTKEAYSGLDLSIVGKKRASLDFIKSYDLRYMHNDFEDSIFKRYPSLAKLKEQLGPYSLLCGSGSCMFGLFETADEAKEAYDSVKEEYDKVFLTTTFNRLCRKSASVAGLAKIS